MMRGQQRMVTVKKDRLVTALTENRAAHREMFERAQEGYRAEVIRVLDARLQQARDGGRIDTYIGLVEPKDFTTEYDAALDALDWEVEDEVSLTEEEFRQLVRNEWNWMQQFTASTQVYLAE